MKARDHEVLVHAVCLGVGYGIRRFYKHRDDAPDGVTLAQLADTVEQAVIDEISVWFEMDGDGN